MSKMIPLEILVRKPSGGNVHGTVWAREISSGTPRLLIAAILFYRD
jgi:hypothetical protein